ncbi:MAG TPA: UDP-N-acetylmuramate dehydrogenase [Membranihabitans sp.]|nr:UDP-N-acetylmuramate dehydrogenase [Membranihabitans sp.]
MRIDSQVSLQAYNTFGIAAGVDQLITVETAEDLYDLKNELKVGLLIGGGSNILLTQPRYETVMVNRIQGMGIVEENEENVIIAVGSGENWHELVQWTLSKDYGGLENLSLIPGTTGAAPIQNIGAYGVEVKDIIVGLDYYRFEDQSIVYIPAKNCQFRYRDSIFKNEWKDQGFITKIYLRLSKCHHIIRKEYRALKVFLDTQGLTQPTIQQISQAVIAIRQSKLPDWRKLGNAGSFFKNPIVPVSVYDRLVAQHPNLPFFPVDNEYIKIPAAWLIEQAGFKGKRSGAVGCYEFQPLVLVNYGGATGAEILELKDTIQMKIRQLFGIELTPEVTIV